MVDASLLMGAVLSFGLLAMMLRMMLVHILCGLLFMGCAGYTMMRGQESQRPLHRWLWFVCTGCVMFLFSYWALQVVFRPPKIKESIGCGGVRFVNERGEFVDPGAADRPGGLRTEL